MTTRLAPSPRTQQTRQTVALAPLPENALNGVPHRRYPLTDITGPIPFPTLGKGEVHLNRPLRTRPTKRNEHGYIQTTIALFTAAVIATLPVYGMWKLVNETNYTQVTNTQTITHHSAGNLNHNKITP